MSCWARGLVSRDKAREKFVEARARFSRIRGTGSGRERGFVRACAALARPRGERRAC